MSRGISAEDQLRRLADGLDLLSGGVPEGLFSGTDRLVSSRFDVYRNNVREGLIGALAVRHPVTERLVGRPFFTGMAEAFISRHPPSSPVLLEWGDELADFVEGFEPAASLPYLPDVVRLEAARIRSYHAADILPLRAESYARLAPENLPAVVLTPHPAMNIVRSSHPVATFWHENREGSVPGPIRDWSGQDVLITRPALTVELRLLPPGAAVFIGTLAAGSTMAESLDVAMRHDPGFDPAGALAIIIQSGSFSACHIKKEETHVPH